MVEGILFFYLSGIGPFWDPYVIKVSSLLKGDLGRIGLYFLGYFGCWNGLGLGFRV